MASSTRREDEHKGLETLSAHSMAAGKAPCRPALTSPRWALPWLGKQAACSLMRPGRTWRTPVKARLCPPSWRSHRAPWYRGKGERGAEKAPPSHTVRSSLGAAQGKAGSSSSLAWWHLPRWAPVPASPPLKSKELTAWALPGNSRTQENVPKHLPWAQAAGRRVKVGFPPVPPPRPTGPHVRSASTASLPAQATQNSFSRGRPGAPEGWGPHREWRIPRVPPGRGEARPALRERSQENRVEHRHPHRERSELRQAPTIRYRCFCCSLLCSRQHRMLCFSQFPASVASPTGVALLFVSFLPLVGGCFKRNFLPFN